MTRSNDKNNWFFTICIILWLFAISWNYLIKKTKDTNQGKLRSQDSIM